MRHPFYIMQNDMVIFVFFYKKDKTCCVRYACLV